MYRVCEEGCHEGARGRCNSFGIMFFEKLIIYKKRANRRKKPNFTQKMINTNIIPYNPNLKERARELRNNSTLSEIILWKQIKGRALGVLFHRQVPILNYIVDFYCTELYLAIELDGSIHDFKYLEDAKRQVAIEEYGVTFLRFSNQEIMNNMPVVLSTIREKIEELKKEQGFLLNPTP